MFTGPADVHRASALQMTSGGQSECLWPARPARELQ